MESVTAGADDGAIARAILVMAHSLKLTVLAEGVETEAQLSFLVRHGCDYVPGFHIAEALAPGTPRGPSGCPPTGVTG